MALEIGHQLQQGRYTILEFLSKGGMGAIYLAEDRNLPGRKVAIKENINTSAAIQEQFQHEAVMLSRLTHPNLPRVTDHFIESSGVQYLVMDYVPGDDLRGILHARAQPLSETTVLEWIEQVMSALIYMHNWIDPLTQKPTPIIHRDIKPGNIKRTPNGRVVLVDFGIAKYEELTEGTVLGAKGRTPGFSPLEQYIGRTDARSDIYALGATCYRLLTNQRPPDSTAIAAGTPLRPPRFYNPDISRTTERVIMRSMALQADDRYQSVAEMREALQQRDDTIQDDVPVSPQTKPTMAFNQAQPPPPTQARRRVWSGLAVLVALMLLGIFMMFIPSLGLVNLLRSAVPPSLVPGTSQDDGSVTAPLVAITRTNSLTPSIGISTATSTATSTGPPPTVTPSETPTESPTELPTASPTAFPTETSASISALPQTATVTETAFMRETERASPSIVASTILTTRTPPSPTAPPTATPTNTPVPSATSTVPPTPTATPTHTATSTAAPTNTPAPSATPTDPPTPTATATGTPTHTATPTAAPTSTPAPSTTPTDLPTPTATSTVPPTPTATAADTATPTAAPTNTPAPTATPTDPPTPTATPTHTATSTAAPTNTPAPSATPTDPPTATATAADTATPTAAPTNTPVPTPQPGALQVNEIDGARYRFVPGGSFPRGSTVEPDERPVHEVHLDAFWVMETEVTNELYGKCVAADACTAPANDFWQDDTLSNHPVTHVDWDQVNAYAEWSGARLPTEAEWEKAARGTDQRLFPWPDDEPGEHGLNINATTTVPVGSYPESASPYGALDMAGNVEEWVSDWYDPAYYAASPAENPQGPEEGVLRVVRGGSFSSNRGAARTANRDRALPDSAFATVGFRLVIPASE